MREMHLGRKCVDKFCFFVRGFDDQLDFGIVLDNVCRQNKSTETLTWPP